MSNLESKKTGPIAPNVVTYLGYQQKDEHIYILTEWSAGSTLQDFVTKYGAISESLARLILYQIILGLEQLQKEGLALVFLDWSNIFLDHKATVKLEAPLLDITVTGQSLSPRVLTLPELILG
jgi:serine/threonine protein kinase